MPTPASRNAAAAKLTRTLSWAERGAVVCADVLRAAGELGPVADLVVVNKSDRDGADRVLAGIKLRDRRREVERPGRRQIA